MTDMKRRKETFAAVLILIIMLIFVAFVAAIVATIVVNRQSEKETTAMSDNVEVFYSQEELDEILANTLLDAQEETNRQVEAKEKELLSRIQLSLEDGNTFVETLRPLYPDDIVLVSNGSFHFVPISSTLAHNTYSLDGLKILESGELQYLENGEVISYKGIDVSKFQGKIDWQKVAADGVDFAFIRAGIRGYGSGKLVEDEFFEENMKGAKDAGIKVGVYFFSQAINEEELLEEANMVLNMVEPYDIECPIVYDVEKVAASDGRMNLISIEERTKLAALFCDTISNAGYKPMIYHNMEMSVLMLDLNRLEQYDKWLAYYNKDLYYPYAYDVWQYTESGKVDGISTDVDMNISFVPLWN